MLTNEIQKKKVRLRTPCLIYGEGIAFRQGIFEGDEMNITPP
jgi:hypothetical protein